MLEYFSPIIRGQTRLLLGFGVFFLIAGLPMLLGGPLVEASWWQRVSFGLVGALMVVPGVHLVRRALSPPARHPALRTLLEAPSSVVWVYSARSMSSTGENHLASELVLGTQEGKQLRLPCIAKQEDRGLNLVAAHLPHATLGFSQELRTKFRQNPSLLRRPRAPDLRP